MTDGRSYDNVVGPARLLRGKNIKCYAVGIGRKFNRRQLLQIAGGDRRHVLTAGFRNLRSIAGTIGRRACKGTAKLTIATCAQMTDYLIDGEAFRKIDGHFKQRCLHQNINIYFFRCDF